MHYKQIENAIDLDLLEQLASKYSDVSKFAYASTAYIKPPATLNGTLPDWHLTPLSVDDRAAVLSCISNNPDFVHIKKLNRAVINVHRMPTGTSIACHHDHCMSSITVCLTGDYRGGVFNELGSNGEVINSMQLDKNQACLYHRPDCALSPGHTVSEVTHGTRLSLQIFIPGDLNKKD